MLAAVAGLAAFSLLTIYSSTHANSALVGDRPLYYVTRQALWFALGFGGLLVLAIMDYHQVLQARRVIYVFMLATLVFVLIFAPSVRETTRFIPIGPFRFLPSEFAKLGLIITLTGVLTNQGKQIQQIPQLLMSLLHVAVPMMLILRQPALGSTLTVLVVWTAMVFAAGARLPHMAGIGLAMSGASVVAWFTGVIKPYQKARLLAFLDPAADPMGAGYHLRQSKIAIGAGQALGAGLLQGSQTQLHFIPDQHTDFIFTCVGEEIGFLGGMLLLLLYGIIVWRALEIALSAKDTAGSLIAVGVVTLVVFHIVINIGMTVGLAPPTGVALPLFSYGGSQVMAMLAGIGLLQSIYIRRNPLQFAR